MFLGELAVHFATAAAADSIRRESALDVHEMQGRAESRLALLHDLAAALELPDSFARSWDSFEECLGTLEHPVVLIVHDAPALMRTLPDDMATLVTLWCAAAAARDGLQLVLVV